MDTDVHTIRATDMATLDDLRAELHEATAAAAAAGAQVVELKRGVASMADRYAAADFGTRGLTQAINAVEEAVASVPTLDDLDEALSVVNREISATAALTEVAETLGAEGNIRAFRAA